MAKKILAEGFHGSSCRREADDTKMEEEGSWPWYREDGLYPATLSWVSSCWTEMFQPCGQGHRVPISVVRPY